jgi:ADP-ribose pyrophosphatase YjhB (NUDIX family)
MPTIHCLVVNSGRVLLDRRRDVLRPIREPVNSGESPLEACLRAVREETGWKVNPSCVALISTLAEGHELDYSLVFVADAPEAGALPEKGEFEWVAADDIPKREDIGELNREIIPELLGSGQPVAVVLEVVGAGSEPAERRLVDITPIDLARLSPLVFAVAP